MNLREGKITQTRRREGRNREMIVSEWLGMWGDLGNWKKLKLPLKLSIQLNNQKLIWNLQWRIWNKTVTGNLWLQGNYYNASDPQQRRCQQIKNVRWTKETSNSKKKLCLLVCLPTLCVEFWYILQLIHYNHV